LLSVVLYFATNEWFNKRWVIKINTHSYFAFPVLFGVLFVVLGGIAANIMLKKIHWQTRLALSVKNLHRLSGWFLIELALGAVVTGIYFYRTNEKHLIDFPLEVFDIALFILLLGICEVIYRRSLKKDSILVAPE
jgi:hypothetical protein